MGGSKKFVLSAAGLGLGLVAWSFLALLTGNHAIVPGPIATAQSSVALLREGYSIDLGATAARSVAAWAIALGLGVPIGIVIGLSQETLAASRSLLGFLRSLPAFMLITIPVAMNLGGESSRIMTAAFACLVVVVDATAEALTRCSVDRSDVFRVYGAGKVFTAIHLLLFEALGHVVVPMAKTVVGLSFVITIVCETLVIPANGIGARLGTALGEADLTRVYAFLLLTGLAASLLNLATVMIARRLVFWSRD